MESIKPDKKPLQNGRTIYKRPAVLPKTYEKLKKLAEKESLTLVDWFERHIDEW